jgi:hypothetical protein
MAILIPDNLPSIDRPSVARPAAALARRLSSVMDVERYRLAGGTALAWALGHRLSEDLDFFIRDADGLHTGDQERLAAALRRLDQQAIVDISQSRTLHAVVADCQVSFFGLGGRWLSDGQRTREGVVLATIEEIAAMKLVAVGTRSTKKDFLDLHVLVQQGYTASSMYAALTAMYPEDISDDAGRHLVRALVSFEDAELDPDPTLLLPDMTWDDAKRTAQRLSQTLGQYLRHT